MNELKRTPNFTSAEEELLLLLVNKYKHILECKMTNSIQNRKKVETWTLIKNEYNRNSLGTVYRNALVLKNKYLNLKKRVQKKIADEKAGVKGIGGGPCLKLNLDSSDTIVCEIMGDKRLGLQCSKSDDNENVQDQYFSRPSTNTSSDAFMVPVEQGLVEEILEVNSDIFKEPILPSNKRRLNDQMSSWASGKVALAQLQEKAFIEQSQIKSKLMKEESSARMAKEERLARMQEKVELLKEK